MRQRSDCIHSLGSPPTRCSIVSAGLYVYVTAHILHACFPTLTPGGSGAWCITRRAQYEMTCTQQSHSHEYTVSHCYAAGVTYQHPPPPSDTLTQFLAQCKHSIITVCRKCRGGVFKGFIKHIFQRFSRLEDSALP